MINTKQIYCTKCQEITPQVDCTCNFMCAICGHKNDLRNSLPPNCNARIIEEIKELEALRDKLVQEKKETAPTEEEMLEWAKKHEQNNNPQLQSEEILKWTENLVQVLKEAVEYLDDNKLNYIASTSNLHKKMKDAINKHNP